jgi:hypothetical protein
MRPLPTSWKDITLSDYQKIYPTIISPDYDTDLERFIEIACILTETTINTVPIKEVKVLSFLMSPDAIPTKVPKAFSFKNKLYKTEIDFNKISGGQYIDLTSYTREPDDIIKNMHFLMAIMSSPCNWIGIKKKYDAEEMIKRAELFKQLPITIVYPLCVFFCQNLANSITSMQTYLVEQSEKLVKDLQRMSRLTVGS